MASAEKLLMDFVDAFSLGTLGANEFMHDDSTLSTFGLNKKPLQMCGSADIRSHLYTMGVSFGGPKTVICDRNGSTSLVSIECRVMGSVKRLIVRVEDGQQYFVQLLIA